MTRLLPWTLGFLLTVALGCDSDDDKDSSEGGEAGEEAGEEGEESGDSSGSETGQVCENPTEPLQLTWGAACETNEECVALIGEGAICDTMAVVYELPGGFCTKPCSMPDADTTVVRNDPQCDPNGGVDCVGRMGAYERCVVPCCDSMQCNRDQYDCRQMPQIATPSDPTYCLMPEECLPTCPT